MPTLPPVGYSLVFSEDFTGSSLPSPWQRGYYFSNTVPSGAVTVSGGALHLTWTRGGVSDISVSSGAQTWHYGYFEVRMKWTTDVGAWPAFWFIPEAGPQHTGEIDVFEGQGNDNQAFFATLHEWNGSSQIFQSTPNRFPISGIDFSVYHTYGLLWTADGNFEWFCDGVSIHTYSGAPSIFDTQSVFAILSMQEGNDWSPGNLSGVSASSLTLDVDYFKVYQQSSSSPVITSFTASPSSVNPGASATLAWVTSGETSLSIDNGVGDVTGLTSKSVTVDATTTYKLTATNSAGIVVAVATALVTVTGGSGGDGGGTGTGGGTGRGPTGENIRYHQIRSVDRHGVAPKIQMYAGTGTPRILAAYTDDGSLTNSGIPVSTGGSTAVGTWTREFLVGSLDGSNGTFAISHNPIPGTLTVYLNGVEQTWARWVTINDLAITFTVPPISIDILEAEYEY